LNRLGCAVRTSCTSTERRRILFVSSAPLDLPTEGKTESAQASLPCASLARPNRRKHLQRSQPPFPPSLRIDHTPHPVRSRAKSSSPTQRESFRRAATSCADQSPPR